MIKKLSQHFLKGHAIVEVILAMSIFAMIAASVATLSVEAFSTNARSAELLQARALAEEGLEAVRVIRSNAPWSIFSFRQSGLTNERGVWEFRGEGTHDVVGKFTRVLFLEDVCRGETHRIVPCPGVYRDTQTKTVRARVKWDDGTADGGSLEKQGHIVNFGS